MSHFTKTRTRLNTLPDGRVLSFGLFGAGADNIPSSASLGQNHHVIFYFHGCPSSHDEAFIFHHAAIKQGVRIIALDRPGHADSSLQPNRRITDWPTNVLAVADHYPNQALRHLGSLVWLPLRPGMLELHFPRSTSDRRHLFRPLPARAGARWTMCKAAHDEEHPERFEQIVQEDLKSRPAVDRAVLDADANGVWSAMITSVRDAMRPGGKGPAHDVKLAGSHWGFELEKMDDGQGMVWWPGTEDINVPLSMAEKALKCAPGAELRIVEGEGHVSLAVQKSNEILLTLVT